MGIKMGEDGERGWEKGGKRRCMFCWVRDGFDDGLGSYCKYVYDEIDDQAIDEWNGW